MDETEQEDSLGHSEVGPGLWPSLELTGRYSGGCGYGLAMSKAGQTEIEAGRSIWLLTGLDIRKQ